MLWLRALAFPGTILERRVLAFAAVLVALTGCAQVNPEPDYSQAANVVRERTGVEDVYSPMQDETVADAVSTLLEDGLTVDEAVRVALLNNPAFQASFTTIGASRADVVQSTLWTNPSISFGYQFTDASGRARLTAGLAQQIADLWQIPIRKRIAEADLEQTLLATAERGIALVAETRTRCYRLLALRQTEASLHEDRSLAERALDIAQALLDAGETNQLDTNLARSAVIDIELELQTVEQERQTAEIDLAQTLGLSRWTQAWTLTDELPPAAESLPDDATLIATAIEQRLDARRAMLAVQRAENDVTREYLRIFPDMTLALEFERPEERALPPRKILADTVRSSIAAGGLAAPSIQSRGERRIEQAQIIDSVLGPALTVTVPLWDQNQAQIARARFVAQQRRKELEGLLDTVVSEVQTAATAARSAAARVALYEQRALPQAKQNVDDALRLYQQGEQSMVVVLDTREALLRLHRSYYAARRDYAIALAALEKALAGRLEPPPTTQAAESGGS